jgi:hypothetical protein
MLQVTSRPNPEQPVNDDNAIIPERLGTAGRLAQIAFNRPEKMNAQRVRQGVLSRPETEDQKRKAGD